VVLVVVDAEGGGWVLDRVDVFLFALVVGVLTDVPVSKLGEEIAHARGLPKVFFLHLLAVVGVVGHLDHVHFLGLVVVGLDHCGVGLQVGSIVPDVVEGASVGGVLGEEVAEHECRSNRPPSKGFLRLINGFQVREIVDESLVRHDWHASLEALGSAANDARDGPEEQTASHPVDRKQLLILLLDFVLISPWDALGARHKFTETVSDPWVVHDVVLEEIHVLVLHLLRGNWCHSLLEDLFLDALVLASNSILFSIVGSLSECVMVGVIVERRHYY
jgi:hypothetical protein